ncbi:MAG: agmatine deiminase [Butyrivibrio sp.]|nr:agmatine deiminase [Butyrivibrio sp.]
MEKKLTKPQLDGYYMPAEFGRHDGTIMIYPTRPGSWGVDRSGALDSFGKIFLEIIKRENLYLLADKSHYDEAIEFMDEIITGYCDELRDTGRYEEVFQNYLESEKASEKKSEEAVILEDIFEDRCLILPIESDDAWARDVAPTFVTDGNGSVRGVSWKFNAWGGEVDGLYASWEKDDRLAHNFCDMCEIDCYDAAPFVLEGGSIHSDGEGTLMVTESCLLSKGRNPQLSKEEISDKLKEYLSVSKVLWLPRGIYNDETNEHVDNVCAFVSPGEVVLAWTDDENDPQYELSKACLDYLENETDAKGRTIKVHKLPIPEHPVCVTEKDLDNYEFEEGEDDRKVGERLAASYVNYYYLNGAVLVPQFGGENEESDKKAIEILKDLCGDREVIGIPARDILLGGGNIHCITQQIPQNNM